MLFEIWQSRNNKYNKNLLPQHTTISKINTQLQNNKHTTKITDEMIH